MSEVFSHARSLVLHDEPVAFGNENIQFIRDGNALHGLCRIEFSTGARLEATINGQVAGSCALFGEQPTQANLNSLSSSFSLTLDYTLLQDCLGDELVFTLHDGEANPIFSLGVSHLLVSSLPLSDNAMKIFPSYGFFGGVKREPLALEINATILQLTLKIDCEKSVLNFSSLKVFDEKGHLISPARATVSVSSLLNKIKPGDVLHGAGFHSKQEDFPYVTVRFHEPQFVSHIHIVNRGDKWGKRARNLCAEVSLENELIHKIYSPFCEIEKRLFLAELVEQCGKPMFSALESADRSRVLSSLLSALQQEPDNMELARLSLHCLSTWAEGNNIRAGNLLMLEIQILAFYVFNILRAGLSGSLLPFSPLLGDAHYVESLEKSVNTLRRNYQQSEILFTKHGIAPAGVLIRNQKVVLETISEMVTDLEADELKPCLAYGTLLGAQREGGFIAHDDDTDLLVEYPLTVQTLDDAIRYSKVLCTKLNNDKYRAYVKSTAVIHLTLRKTNIMVDIFPYWGNGGERMLYMDNMQPRAIDAKILTDRSTIALYGQVFPAPADPVAFLEARYGERWNRPDRFHEWQWAIKQTSWSEVA